MFIVSLEVTVTSLHPPRQHTRKGKEDKKNPTGAKERLGRGGGPTGAPLRRGQP